MNFQYIILCVLIALVAADYETPNPNVRDAQEGEFPHQVSLHWHDGENHFYICAGTLINANWVLTLSMCVQVLPDYGFILVKLGMLKTAGYSDRITQIGSNQNYVNGGIALLKLNTPAQLYINNLVGTISIPSYDIYPNTNATTIGWAGESNHQGPLKAVDVNLLYGSVCNHLFNLAVHPFFNFCTVQNNAKPSCISDAGAPLLVKDNGKVIIYGVAAISKHPCEQSKGLTIYESVSKYVSWIKETIRTK